MKLLITGGAGFIGSNFAEYALRNLGELTEIIILDKLTYAGNIENLNSIIENHKVRFVHGDICDSDTTTPLISEVDYILNFAAESHVDNSIISSKPFIDTNIDGVRNLLDGILKTQKEIRFVQISTDEVYGSINVGSWKEDSPIQPNSPYSASKASGELIARSYFKTYGLDIVITRASNNYGPFQHTEKLIPLIITNLIEEKTIPIYGDGMNVRDWLHVEDHCQGVLKAMLNGTKGSTYNIGGGCELTNLELTKKILSIFDLDESRIKFVQDRKGHDFRYSINTEKSRSELGYSPLINFESGIQQTVDWYRQNLDWWKSLK